MKNKRSPGRSCGFFTHSLWASAAFFLGYGLASIYSPAQFVTYLTTYFSNTPKPNIATNQTVEIPKPKFEFYTLLTKEVAAQSEQSATTAVALEVQPVKTPVTPSSQLNASTTEVIPEKAVPAAPVSLTQSQQATQTVVAALQDASSKNMQGTYVLQLASFRRMVDAERLKANLMMKGISARIVSVHQQQDNWYRVILGPFAGRPEAERAKLAIAKSQRITGMIRKNDA